MMVPLPAWAQPVVLELFTSQGCSSCPPADRVLARLSAEPDIIALSMHVMYWDRLGWKDPFALESATQRQHAYAGAMRRTNVFTPQLVVNGRYSVTGSDQPGIAAILDKTARHDHMLDLRIENNRLHLPALAAPTDAVIEEIAYLPAAETDVPRGENAGNRLQSVNIVISITPLGAWRGAEKTLALPKTTDAFKHVILIRDKTTLAILGARRL